MIGDREQEAERRQLFNNIALNVISKLESYEDITHVHFAGRYRAAFYDVLAWEDTNAPYRLPEDLKLFYTTAFNGVDLRWLTNVQGKPTVIGEIKINEMKCLSPPKFPVSLPQAPDGSDYSAVFVLNSHQEIGDILLVYNRESEDADTSIWFRDNTDRQCSYVCSSFTHLLRIMVVHLGIIGWQRAFTPNGLSTSTQSWMYLFAKERLCIDRCAVGSQSI